MRNDKFPISKSPSIQLARFPMRHNGAIWVSSDSDCWQVQAHNHGWLHGDLADAFNNAAWLSRNLNLPIRASIQSS